jgi:hypothetical protein
MKIQFLFYVIHIILLIFLDAPHGSFPPLSLSCRDIVPTFCDSVLVPKT